MHCKGDLGYGAAAGSGKDAAGRQNLRSDREGSGCLLYTSKFATSPLYSTSYSAVTPKDEQVKQPTIIYVMDESYWDVSELEQYGITFDTRCV